MLASFRGGKAHDYNQLWAWYRSQGGQPAPSAVNRAFALVQGWSTEIRYSPEAWRRSDAEQFLRSVEVIADWAKGRL